ncbi:hypothetical protein BDQ17DRAFT_261810 [Cyathus striatus]|nr:hypothetical protein BDQ17DRAFT_261810 [Cyathus striatus]
MRAWGESRDPSLAVMVYFSRMEMGDPSRLAGVSLLKLIRGSLDQVDQKASITWVQPRVLSREQIGGIASRLEEWIGKLNKVEQRVAPEVASV